MPTTAECNDVLKAIKQLGGSATSVELAKHLKIEREKLTKKLRIMRTFRMVYVVGGHLRNKKHGFIYGVVK